MNVASVENRRSPLALIFRFFVFTPIEVELPGTTWQNDSYWKRLGEASLRASCSRQRHTHRRSTGACQRDRPVGCDTRRSAWRDDVIRPVSKPCANRCTGRRWILERPVPCRNRHAHLGGRTLHASWSSWKPRRRCCGAWPRRADGPLDLLLPPFPEFDLGMPTTMGSRAAEFLCQLLPPVSKARRVPVISYPHTHVRTHKTVQKTRVSSSFFEFKFAHEQFPEPRHRS